MFLCSLFFFHVYTSNLGDVSKEISAIVVDICCTAESLISKYQFQFIKRLIICLY